MNARRFCNALLATALCCSFLLAPTMVESQTDARLGYRVVNPTIVLVRVWANKETQLATGTGFVVQSTAADSYILTARHVVKGAAFVTVDLMALKKSPTATIVLLGAAGSNREDLALLRISVGHLPAVTFDDATPEVGEPLAAVGFPKTSIDLEASGLGLTSLLLGPGIVSSLPEQRSLMTVANVSFQEGESGSPVFDLTNGQIVGLVDSQLPGEAVNGIAIGERVMVPFLNRKLSGVRVDRHEQLALGAANATVVAAASPAPPTPAPAPPAPPTPAPAAPAPATPVPPTPAPAAPPSAVALATPAPFHRADPTVPIRSAEGYLSSGKYDLAVNAVKSALAIDPTFPRAWLDMGLIFFRTNHRDAAIAAFTNAIKYDPQYALAYNNRGYSYAQAGQYAPAIADFGQAIALDPKNSHAYTNRGTVYLYEHQVDPALADFNQAISLDPTNPISYSNRGDAYFTKGDLDDAAADYNHALAINPKYSRAYLGLGNVYVNRKQYDQAIASFTKSLGLDPKNAKVLSSRGMLYAVTGQYAQAIADCNQALALDPKNAYAYYYRGLANFKMGQTAAANTDYQQAMTLAPQQQWAPYH